MTIVVIVFCAYLTLDKWVVPKYFKDYGIENMHDLVGMVKTLYNSPKESEMTTNGFTSGDHVNAVRKLQKIGIPSLQNGEIDYLAVADGLNRDEIKSGSYYFSDREIASVLDGMLESGILASQLPDIRYLDTLKLNVLELIISPTKIGDGDQAQYSTKSASVSFLFKLDTTSVRSQMAVEMDTPLFLLNMIVPKTIYISVSYNLAQNDSGDWDIDDGHVGINGRTEKDSEILLNLLIKFIFPPEDEMTTAKLSKECGSILVKGLNLIGDMSLYPAKGDRGNGVILNI